MSEPSLGQGGAEHGRRRILPALVACLGLALGSAPALATPDLVPHVAVYDLSLSQQRRNEKVSTVAGRYRFEVQDVCDGWAMTHKAQMMVSFLNGSAEAFLWRLSTWEAKDGTSYRFFLHRMSGDSVQEIEGAATLEQPGGPGEAIYFKDGAEPVDLPRGTVFPAYQSAQMLRAARDGVLPMRWTLFDGWDKRVVGVSGFPIARYEAGRPGRLLSPVLDRQGSWRIQIGYYDLANGADVPEQEQEIRLYDNGMIGEFTFDYGAFSVDGVLTSLDDAAASDC